jgi:hypothetical protein
MLLALPCFKDMCTRTAALIVLAHTPPLSPRFFENKAQTCHKCNAVLLLSHRRDGTDAVGVVRAPPGPGAVLTEGYGRRAGLEDPGSPAVAALQHHDNRHIQRLCLVGTCGYRLPDKTRVTSWYLL